MPEEEIVEILEEINGNLELIAKHLSESSFWDSQWFSALVGASAALSVVFIEQFFSWRRNSRNNLLDFCKWLNEQWTFRSPDALLDKARRTTYAHTEVDKKTKTTKSAPEKPLGEKMVIALRKDIKYWKEPSRKLQKLFKNYESALRAFDELIDDDNEHEKRLLTKAMEEFEKIDIYAYKITGDNEWTAR